jgi:hypothetical protein
MARQGALIITCILMRTFGYPNILQCGSVTLVTRHFNDYEEEELKEFEEFEEFNEA